MLHKISDGKKRIDESGCKCGNKAGFLAKLRENGFPVPDGVILDSAVYDSFIRFHGMDEQIKGLLDGLTGENVKETGKALEALFDNRSLEESIKVKLAASIDPQQAYAVRSSATKEDLEEFSFAGQYQTYLNVQGMEEIERRIIDCYRSMFGETSLNYILNQGIGFEDLSMAVVVQEMVQADYSGICFTVNPITGNDRQMLIEVSKGLGEAIVSGKVKPEQYGYDWYRDVVEKDAQNQLLDEGSLKEMGNVFLQIQLLFGYPCDIEFAVQEGKLYILQARRITRINYGDMQDIWSTADFKDGGVSATICTPYMWSLYEYIWEFTLRKFILDSKILKEQSLNKKLGDMFYARCYWNLSVVKEAMSQVIGYKEREFDSEYGVQITYEGDGATTKISLKSLVSIVRMFFAQKKILKERNENAENYKGDLLQKYENYRKRYDDKTIGNIEKVWYELTRKTYLQSEATYFWQIFINTIHQSLYKDSLLKYVSESEYLTLLGSIDNISHMLPFYAMWDISRRIREKEQIFTYWRETSVEELCSALDTADNYMPLVKKLVEEFGYHSDRELDVTYPCYYEDCSPLVAGIKDMLDLSDEFGPQKDKESGREKYETLLQQIAEKAGSRKGAKVRTKVEKMRKMLWWREEFRDISTRFYYLIRVYTMELAKHLHAKSVLEKEEDIWFLKVGNLWDYLDGKADAATLRELVEKNKQYYYSFRNYMSENEIGECFRAGAGKEATGQGLIKGLGANSGIVRGTARVIEDFSEIDRLQENDILVTKFTDTGWTPKFAILSGIVTEYGGILCHAAIVSREYGIPAIVSCHDVMSKIKDGQIITIDGATGIVTVEET